MTGQQRIVVRDGEAEVFLGGPDSSGVLCAAHPGDRFDAGTVALLAEMTRLRVTCVNPRAPHASGSAVPSLEEMIDRIEEVRDRLGFGRWIFWGMSGGGWLAQIYARRYPDSLAGIVIESACLCFRERLADPDCLLSPFFPAWREGLQAAGLLPESSPDEAGDVSGEETAWLQVDGVGEVFRRRGGGALLVSPGPLAPEMKSIMPRLWEFDSRSWIRAVPTPALVLCGTADPVLPVRHARAVHEAIEGSTFVEIAGGGHVPVTERRAEVTAALQEFLSRMSWAADRPVY